MIRCELPEETIRQTLSELPPSALNRELLGDFIDCIKETCAFKPGFQIDCFDCSGTGGSGLAHFNTSTVAAFVLAAGGVKVAKFGNKASSGGGGSFDLLAQAGIQPDLHFERALEILDRVGLVFLFAPQYYPGLAQLAPIRKSLKTPTVFNAIGPLLHPYAPAKRVMGTASEQVQELVSNYLAQSVESLDVVVVRSQSGLDEFDPADHSHYIRIVDSQMERKTVPPSIESGVQPTTALENFACFEQLLLGNASTYITKLVCLNAGVGFAVWGVTDSIESGAEYAAELIDGSAVRAKFEELRRAYAGIAR